MWSYERVCVGVGGLLDSLGSVRVGMICKRRWGLRCGRKISGLVIGYSQESLSSQVGRRRLSIDTTP